MGCRRRVWSCQARGPQCRIRADRRAVLPGAVEGVSRQMAAPLARPPLASRRRTNFLLPTMTAPSTLPDAAMPDARFDALAERLGPARLERDEALAPYTTFHIGGPADL